MELIRAAQNLVDTWDLSSLFQSIEDWEKEIEPLRLEIKSLGEFKGSLEKDAKKVELFLPQYFSCQEKLEKIYTYAHLLSDQDTTDTSNKKLLEIAVNLYSQFSSATSFVAPELIKLSDEDFKELFDNPVLKIYNMFLNEIFREKKHILSEAEEFLLARSAEALSSPREIFGQLNNADLSFGEILVENKPIKLTHGNFITYLTKQDRSIREVAYKTYLKSYKDHQYSLASILIGNLKKDAFYSEVRKHESTLARSLFSDNIPTTVYHRLVDTISENINCLHEYYGFRKKLLKLDSQYIYDTYVPLVSEIKLNFTYEESVKLICEALEPLGPEYVDTLHRGLTEERWVDRYENKGKRSGAYSSGCFGSKPYILMNYQNTGLESLFTLAHEAGHSMHSFLSAKHQPYPTSSYTIFVAEVASTFNELLLCDYMSRKYPDDKEVQSYLTNHLLDDLKSTVFRQTMFAEFERDSHKLADEGLPVTLDTLLAIHGKLQRKYFGESLEFTELDSLECLRIPHFYSSFYVYKYATGMAAALNLSNKVLSGENGFVGKYLNFLSSGSSKYSLELLKAAGVDLESKEPVLEVTKTFERNLAKLKNSLGHN